MKIKHTKNTKKEDKPESKNAKSTDEHIFTLRIQNMEYFNIRAPFFLRYPPYNLTDEVFSEAMLDINEVIASIKKKTDKIREAPIQTASILERILWYSTLFAFAVTVIWIIFGMIVNYFFYLSSPFTPYLTWEYVQQNYLTFSNIILPAQFWELAFYFILIIMIFLLIISIIYSCCIKNCLLEEVIFNTKLSRFGKWRNEMIEKKKWEGRVFNKVCKILKSYNRSQFEPINKLRFNFVLHRSTYPMCEKPRKDSVRRFCILCD